MKGLILSSSVLAAALLFTSSAQAKGDHVEAKKKQLAEHYDGLIAAFTTAKGCIQEAADGKAIKACRKALKMERGELKKKHKAAKAAMKAEKGAEKAPKQSQEESNMAE